jgi:hypothetical protein
MTLELLTIAIWNGITGFFAYPFMIGIVILILSIAYIVATENDSYGPSIFLTVVAALLYSKWIVGLFVFWPKLLGGIIFYALIGVAYSVWKWYLYCREFVQTYHLPSNYDKNCLEDHYRIHLIPSENKSLLIGWIVYWPWSLLWNLVGKALIAIYENLVYVYESVADSVIKNQLNSQLHTTTLPQNFREPPTISNNKA